jgi:hypothetical protein
LPADQGALVVKALESADQALRADEAGGPTAGESSAEELEARVQPAWVERQADALTLVAETLLAHGARGLAAGDRHLVSVHVNVNVLAAEGATSEHGGNDVQCHVHDGPALAREVVRRFACDASVVALLENERGEVLDVGRKTRAIPPALRRALEKRDRGCQFPGCSCTRFVDAHHVEHWANGGATRLDNLVLLCRHHHRLVHEGGFSLVMERGEVTVRRADGRVLERAPRQSSLSEAGHEALRRSNDALGLATTVPSN